MSESVNILHTRAIPYFFSHFIFGRHIEKLCYCKRDIAATTKLAALSLLTICCHHQNIVARIIHAWNHSQIKWRPHKECLRKFLICRNLCLHFTLRVCVCVVFVCGHKRQLICLAQLSGRCCDDAMVVAADAEQHRCPTHEVCNLSFCGQCSNRCMFIRIWIMYTLVDIFMHTYFRIIWCVLYIWKIWCRRISLYLSICVLFVYIKCCFHLFSERVAFLLFLRSTAFLAMKWSASFWFYFFV